MERAVRLTGAVTGASPGRFWPQASEASGEPVTTSRPPVRCRIWGTRAVALNIGAHPTRMPAEANVIGVMTPITGSRPRDADSPDPGSVREAVWGRHHKSRH